MIREKLPVPQYRDNRVRLSRIAELTLPKLLSEVPDLIIRSSVVRGEGKFPPPGLPVSGFYSAASSPRAEILLQLRLADDPIISLIDAADLILRLSLSSRKQEDDLVPTLPDIMRWMNLRVTHSLSYSVAVRSHGMVLLKTFIMRLLRHDNPCAITKEMAARAAITPTMSVRFHGSFVQGWRELSCILFSFILDDRERLIGLS